MPVFDRPFITLRPRRKSRVLVYWPCLKLYENAALRTGEQGHVKLFLMNKSNVTWRNCSLVFKQTWPNQPIVTSPPVPVINLKPRDCAVIGITVDPNGCEGDFELEFELKTKNGQPCFPLQNNIFTVTVHIDAPSETNERS